MTRGKKIQKLANAVKKYRGSYHSLPSGEIDKWIRPPDRGEVGHIKSLLSDLGCDVQLGLQAINGFKDLNQFHAWIKNL